MSELAVFRRKVRFAYAPDFPPGHASAELEHGSLATGAPEGAQILCRRDGDEVTVVGAHSHRVGLVLLRADREVENGTVVD